MEDADIADGAQRRGGDTGGPQKKYIKALQDVADRKAAQVLIELDDIDEVR